MSSILYNGGGGGGGMGPQGYQGKQGNQGYQGEIGLQGDAGAQGDVGVQGDLGNQGFQGEQGLLGVQGDVGATGNQGDMGFQGLVGDTGPQGNIGLQGELGLQGNQGDVGLQGDYGAQGNQGDIGLQGAQGDIGSQGLQGNQGDIGVQGAQGDIGIQGTQGDTGVQGDSGVQGYQGDLGLQGVQGETGLQGNQGDTGLQGFQGEIGLQGNQGDTGPQGSQGEVGAQGDIGLQGAQGDVGAQGLQGEIGLQGSQGNTGTQGAGGTLGYYGSFYDTSDQTNPVVDTANVMTFNSSYEQNGVHIVTSGGKASQITFDYSGTYNVQFSSVFTHNAANSAEIDIWLSKNGTILSETNTKFTVAGQANNVAAWNFLLSLNAGDYLELYWSSPDGGVSIQSSLAGTGPTRPATPSIILTVQQVMYTQIGPQGLQGEQGVQGYQGYQGYQGDIGFQGSQGYQGDIGAQGYDGVQGDIGLQGAQGFQGDQGIQGDVGFQGNQGQNGYSSSYYKYQAKTTLNSGNPGTGYLIWNNATQTSSTQINISHLTSDNVDIDVFLSLINVGDNIVIQDQSNSNNYQTWQVNSAITVYANSYVEIPVSYQGGGHSFNNNDNIIVAIANIGPVGPQGSQGAQGNQGFQGAQGNQGFQGAQGSQGAQGNQGFQGAGVGTGTTDYLAKFTNSTTVGNSNWSQPAATTNLKPDTAGSLVDLSGSSTNGVKFAAASGGSSTTPSTNSLVLFEQGTWSATVTAASGTVTSPTTGYYTRIGRLVYFTIITTGTSFGGAMTISLPFTPAYDQSLAKAVNTAGTDIGVAMLIKQSTSQLTTGSVAASSVNKIFSGVYEV